MVFVAAAAACLFASAPVLAQTSENPWKDGAYWQVSAIHVKDGSGLTYANYLANTWRPNMEFQRSRGWIKGYHVLVNEFPREGEPDIYLITTFDTMPTPDESDRRATEMRAFTKMSMAQASAASGQRAEYRTVGSQMLLREQVKR
jgi:hypothetical protein